MNQEIFGIFVQKVSEQLEIMYTEDCEGKFSRKTSPTEFEKLVVEASEIVLSNENTSCRIDYTEGGHAFPDIVYHFQDGSYGIEVKSSTQANASPTSWTILGNSILGSTRVEVDDLYIIYIKVGNNGCFIKSARYEDSVSDVAVTHSPRYKLDLNQSSNQSFFSKSGISYDEIKHSDNPIELVTEYFKNQGMTAWWIAESTPAVIKTWNELSSDDKEEILAKSFLFFPEIIYSKASDKYKNLSKWLVANYSVVDSSLRDKYTAGGRLDITTETETFKNMPRIFDTFNTLSFKFLDSLKNASFEELEEYWDSYNPQNDTFENRLSFWKNAISDGFDGNQSIEYKCINTILNKIS